MFNGKPRSNGTVSSILLDLLVREHRADGLDVVLQCEILCRLRWEDIGVLGEDVGKSGVGDAETSEFLAYLVEDGRDLLLVLGESSTATTEGTLGLFLSATCSGVLNLPCPSAPREPSQTELASHGNDLALEIALHRIPLALVDDELGQIVCPRIGVGGTHHPCWHVTRARYSTLPETTSWLSACIISSMLVDQSHQWMYMISI